MKLEPDERAVVCTTCNAYLYAEERPDGADPVRLTTCPYPKDARGECAPPSDEGRYGRS